MNAFKDCTSLKTVIIPGAISTIAESAFSGCKKLYSVSYSDTENFEELVIQSKAFSGCSSLSSFAFNYTVEIGEGAFSGCQMKEANFSLDVRSIGSDAFKSCSQLKTVYYCGRQEVSGSAFEKGVVAYVYVNFKGHFSNCALIYRVGESCEVLPPDTYNPEPEDASLLQIICSAVLFDFE